MSNVEGQLPAPVTETRNKANVATRYAGTFGSGALMVLFALGGLDPDAQKKVLDSIHLIVADTKEIIGAAGNIWYIVWPVIGGLLARMGVNASGFKAMMDKIFAAAQAGNKDAAVTIIKAAAAPQLGTQAIINPVLSREDTPATVAASVSELPPQTQEAVR